MPNQFRLIDHIESFKVPTTRFLPNNRMRKDTRTLQRYTGHCLCGSITFEFTASPDWPHYCCCDDCQKWSGAPTVAWIDFPQDSFRLSDQKGYLRKFKSSAIACRAFCSNCGSSLFAIDDDGRNISVTIVCLDRPNIHHPKSVSYTNFAPRWYPYKKLTPNKVG